MARDTDTDTAATTVRRKRAGGKERRSASSREKTKEEGKGKEAVEEKMAADIQEELTQKLENLLERDRLGVSMRLPTISILQTNRMFGLDIYFLWRFFAKSEEKSCY